MSLIDVYTFEMDVQELESVGDSTHVHGAGCRVVRPPALARGVCLRWFRRAPHRTRHPTLGHNSTMARTDGKEDIADGLVASTSFRAPSLSPKKPAPKKTDVKKADKADTKKPTPVAVSGRNPFVRAFAPQYAKRG